MSLSAVQLLLIVVAVSRCGSANVIVAAPDTTGTNAAAVVPAVVDGTGSGTGTTESLPPTIVVYNGSSDTTAENAAVRDSRFLSFSMVADPTAAATNSVLQEKQDEVAVDPSAHLVDIYTDCLLQLSFPCVQRKLLLFFDKLGRMKGELPKYTRPKFISHPTTPNLTTI